MVVIASLSGLFVLVMLIAGLRMRAGKGAYWGIVSALYLTLQLIINMVTIVGGGNYQGIIGSVITLVLLVTVVNGVRGAFALKNMRGFSDDEADVFS